MSWFRPGAPPCDSSPDAASPPAPRRCPRPVVQDLLSSPTPHSPALDDPDPWGCQACSSPGTLCPLCETWALEEVRAERAFSNLQDQEAEEERLDRQALETTFWQGRQSENAEAAEHDGHLNEEACESHHKAQLESP
ncbi:uncharacterized protein LOC127752022 [Frankliniella occidentalis]|uniref:Uncharacterized protein LOC127752022 n=1 Tax=Frankliniella occidentalis TaxID=133901 RepID=A0A9C6XAV6_FRAOC|nr:uncharacterized protein LOC127752022 [Frankliniella occidentalis]XP_052132440.1 uncharacterized protein LOC127752022 [Frankliniella occidentalis]